MIRPTWDEYFMEMAKLAAKRSTCLRRKVGAVLVMGKKALGTGYNGAPSGLKHCLDIGCEREKRGIPAGERHEICRGLHAENNAIRQALHTRDSLVGAELLCTNSPCNDCAKMIIDEGIKRMVILNRYPDELAEEMLKEAGVRLDIWKDKMKE